jgi:hypothetical protein
LAPPLINLFCINKISGCDKTLGINFVTRKLDKWLDDELDEIENLLFEMEVTLEK